jgi:hypothetical protein
VGLRRPTHRPGIYTPNCTKACRCCQRIAYDQDDAGMALALVPDDVAAPTCAQWQAYPPRFSELHQNELMAILDAEEPSYKT